jgi:S-layer homology domain
MRAQRVARRPRILVVVALAIAAVAFPLGVLAGHRFADVPDSITFHDDIEAIAAAGVTAGCGGGNYCPTDFVTREQMAGFLNRIGALGVGKTPVVNADRLDGLDASAFAGAGHDHDGDYLATTGKAADADLLDGLDAGAFTGAGHDHDGDYLATAGKAADADLLDGYDASSFTGGLKAVRGGFEVDLSTTATTVSTLTLPVSATHSTFFVFFTAQVATSGGPIRCDLVRDDDVVLHSRWVGGYSPYAEYADLSLNSPLWIVDSPNVRVDCLKLEPSATLAKVQDRELQALALGSGS